MKKLTILIGILVLLAACTTAQQRWTWQRGDVLSTEDKLALRVGPVNLQEDILACKKYQREMHGGEHVEEGRFKNCMAIKGWYLAAKN